MKRKRETEGSTSNKDDDSELPTKKKRLMHCKMPLIDKLSLFNLHALHLINNGPFCLRLQLGLAVEEAKCDICNALDNEITRDCTDDAKIDQILDELNMKNSCNLYRVDALLRDIWHNGNSKSICTSYDEKTSIRSIIFYDLDHISWFSIQLILNKSAVSVFECNRKHLKIAFIERGAKAKDEGKSTILNDILVDCHRNLYHFLNTFARPMS
jgi:hypothetical protein